MDMDKTATVVASALSLVGVIVVVVLTVQGNMETAELKNETEELRIEVEGELGLQDLALRRQSQENEQKAREWSVLAKWIPLLVDGSDAQSRRARSVIFVLFAGEAEGHVNRAFSSLTSDEREGQEAAIEEVLGQAQEVDQNAGPWLVVVASAVDLDAAMVEVNRAIDAQFTPIRVYQRTGSFFVTVGDFPGQPDADSMKLVAWETIGETAFVVDLQQWCPDAVEESLEEVVDFQLFDCPATTGDGASDSNGPAE